VVALLSGALAKLGTYGFYRFCLGLFPEAARQCTPILVALAVVGILYGALIAMMQRDIKRVLAYSSLSHLGFVVLGLFAWGEGGNTNVGLYGALIQMVNHGITTGLLFLMTGFLENQRGTLRIRQFGGLWEQMPLFSRLFLIATLSSVALPLTNSFVGEFMILNGAFQHVPWAGALATTGVIASAIYMLWLFQRVFYGTPTRPEVKQMHDLTPNESAVCLPFIALIFLLGIFPTPVLQKLAPTVERTVRSLYNLDAPPGKVRAFTPETPHSAPVSAPITPSGAMPAPAPTATPIPEASLNEVNHGGQNQ
jgi:NADH-quinone oxidoreductase subunit M